ncbi:thermonuclease family protein [Salmonella enterica]|nr:hypothetical protein [Salmonella enterica]EHC5972853.1 hypothetical protein [Salmonella enterica]EIU9581818.1 thermonuclease family protein [Salmonella enterica]ELC1719962.1 thermonuclease family protein [Salmonella enterica]
MLAPSVQANLTGRVVRVIDGDTVVVLTKSERTVRVRLTGIDAPEKGQPFGQCARQFLASRFGRIVEVTGDRILGTLWVDGRDINAELVCGALAWAYHVRNVAQNPANLRCEYAPQEEKKGLWQAPLRKQPRPDV